MTAWSCSVISGGQVRCRAGLVLRQEQSHPAAEPESVSTDTSEQSYPPIRFRCPKCGTTATVRQSQGDRCPGCGFEFKWFLPHEAEPARDYYAILTGEKYFLALAHGAGWIVAHY